MSLVQDGAYTVDFLLQDKQNRDQAIVIVGDKTIDGHGRWVGFNQFKQSWLKKQTFFDVTEINEAEWKSKSAMDKLTLLYSVTNKVELE